ncbi:MAG: uncharacterized protein JWL77_6966, partial [Chthonomonadaceae bacterium]|nr:uncharacterized protein [Chthonomonadaceae bacterium]
LRYLHGTPGLCVIFNGIPKDTNPNTPITAYANSGSPISTTQPISAFTDANWGGDLADRKSTTGTVIKYNDNVISWLSKKQATVALSSTEAEYMAISTAVQEVLWYRMWIKEILGIDITIPLYCDNQSAIELASNDCYHSRTKHIDLRHHFVRDHVIKDHIKIQWVPTVDQEADLLTKMLGTKQFIILRDKLISKA